MRAPAYLAARDNEVVSMDRDGLRISPVYRIEAKEVREIVGLYEIVQRAHLERRLVNQQFQNCASDSSQSVDHQFGAHFAFSMGASATVPAKTELLSFADFFSSSRAI